MSEWACVGGASGAGQVRRHGEFRAACESAARAGIMTRLWPAYASFRRRPHRTGKTIAYRLSCVGRIRSNGQAAMTHAARERKEKEEEEEDGDTQWLQSA